MSEGRLAKPQLRNLHITYLKKGLVGMLLFAGAVGVGYKVLFVDPVHRKIENFYKTYDAEKSLQKMNDSGYMQSCPK